MLLGLGVPAGYHHQQQPMGIKGLMGFLSQEVVVVGQACLEVTVVVPLV